MSQPKPRFSPRFEEFAVRVMYFMTTIDSFVPMAGLAAWLAAVLLFGAAGSWWVLLPSFALTWLAFRLADYYPTFVMVLPFWVVTWVLMSIRFPTDKAVDEPLERAYGAKLR